MEKASARKALVKELRTYARQVKVTQARDDSGRAKVEAMYRKIIAKASVEVKRLVEEKFKAYTETFKTEVATSPAEDTAAGAFRLHGKSFLLSYNWDFFGKRLPDGTSCFNDAGDLWAGWQRWEAERAASFAVKQSTSTLERFTCLLVVLINEGLRLRVHFSNGDDPKNPPRCAESIDHFYTDLFCKREVAV